MEKEEKQCKKGKAFVAEKKRVRKMCGGNFMDVEDEEESRRKLGERMKKLQ